MELLKEFFETEGEKNHEAFNKWLKEKGYKLADLSKGEYIAASKALDSEKKLEKKLADEFAAKETALNEKIAKMEAEYAEKEANAKTTLTEGEKLAKEMKAELEKMRKESETSSKKMEKELEKLQLESTAAKSEAKKEKANALFMKMNGNPDFAELAVEKWLKNDGELSEIAEKFKEEFPVYFTKPEVKTVSTTPGLAGGNKPQGDSDKEIEALYKGAGIKPKE